MSSGQSTNASSYTLAQIFTLKDNAARPADLKNLRIGDYEVRLFQSVLRQQMDLCEDADGNWWLRFFLDSGRPQHLFVRFLDVDVADAMKWSRDKPAHCAALMTQLAYTRLTSNPSDTDSSELQALCSDTSQLVRQSRSVKPDQLYEASTHYGHVSGRGAQFISKPVVRHDHQFRRHVLLHTLAYAYLLTFEDLSNAMSQALMQKDMSDAQQAEALRRLYREVASFDAMSFFHQPVMRSNASTCAAWTRIDSALGITDSHSELLKQLESVHYICDLEAQRLQEEAEKARSAKEARYTFWLSILGLILTVVSGLSAVDTIRGWLP